jgi:hypothetical protein
MGVRETTRKRRETPPVQGIQRGHVEWPRKLASSTSIDDDYGVGESL